MKWEGKVEQDRKYVKWTVFLRSACGDDLSQFISSVTFQLHEDFKPKNRGILFAIEEIFSVYSTYIVFRKPPYEVTEEGWGEFVLMILIQFKSDEHLTLQFPYSLHLLPAEQLTQKSYVSSPSLQTFILCLINYDQNWIDRFI